MAILSNTHPASLVKICLLEPDHLNPSGDPKYTQVVRSTLEEMHKEELIDYVDQSDPSVEFACIPGPSAANVVFIHDYREQRIVLTTVLDKDILRQHLLVLVSDRRVSLRENTLLLLLPNEKDADTISQAVDRSKTDVYKFPYCQYSDFASGTIALMSKCFSKRRGYSVCVMATDSGYRVIHYVDNAVRDFSCIEEVTGLLHVLETGPKVMIQIRTSRHSYDIPEIIRKHFTPEEADITKNNLHGPRNNVVSITDAPYSGYRLDFSPRVPDFALASSEAFHVEGHDLDRLLGVHMKAHLKHLKYI